MLEEPKFVDRARSLGSWAGPEFRMHEWAYYLFSFRYVLTSTVHLRLSDFAHACIVPSERLSITGGA